MSRLPISFFAILLTTTLLLPAATAQDGRISTVDAARAGLKVEWTTQVDVTGVGGKIVDIQLNVNEDRSRTFFAIEYGNQREVISEFDIGPFGVPFGTNPDIAKMDPKFREKIEKMIAQHSDSFIEEETGIDEDTVAAIRQEIIDRVAEAEEFATNRQQQLIAMMDLQGRDVEVKLNKYTLPESTVYVTTTTGFVQAIDADTGLTRWSVTIGNRKYPTIGLGASDEHVAVINGSSVYCLDANNGRQLWDRRCRGSVGSSPMVSGKFIFVPLVNGRLEAFPIENDGIGAESYVSIGRARSRPLVTEDSVCWATDEGYFTVASNDQVSSPHYRLRADSSIVASGTTLDGRLFVASTDGFTYAIKEISGGLLWQFSTGQRVTHSPIPIGNYVYLITDEHKMFKLFAHDGGAVQGWEDPVEDVTRFVGATRDKIYVQNKIGQIVALNQTNGKKVGMISSMSTDLILPNYQSDRLYVGNGSGSVQCLREQGSEVPYFHADEVTEIVDNQGDVKPDAGVGEPVTEEGDAETKDPFAAFDEEDDKKSDNKDPFEGGKKEEDPEDPFGG